MSARDASLVARLQPLMYLVRPQRALLAYAAVSGVLQQLVGLGAATIAAWLVGRSLSGERASELHTGLIVLALSTLPLALLPWLESFWADVAAFRVLADLRERVYGALERLAPAYLIERRSGELGATAIADVELLERFFAHTLSPLIVASTVPLTAVVVLWVLHWTLPLSLLPALALLVTVPAWLRGAALRQGDEIRALLGGLAAHVVDAVQGLRELLAFGCGPAAVMWRFFDYGVVAAVKG